MKRSREYDHAHAKVDVDLAKLLRQCRQKLRNAEEERDEFKKYVGEAEYSAATESRLTARYDTAVNLLRAEVEQIVQRIKLMHSTPDNHHYSSSIELPVDAVAGNHKSGLDEGLVYDATDGLGFSGEGVADNEGKDVLVDDREDGDKDDDDGGIPRHWEYWNASDRQLSRKQLYSTPRHVETRFQYVPRKMPVGMNWDERKKWKNDEERRERDFYKAAHWQYEHEKDKALKDAHFSGIEGEPVRAMTEFHKEANDTQTRRLEAARRYDAFRRSELEDSDEFPDFRHATSLSASIAPVLTKKVLRCGACCQLGHTSRSKDCRLYKPVTKFNS